jgi:ribokinase
MAVRAVIVGSLNMDLVFRVPHRPETDDVVIATDFATYRGGKGYNQAVALARLGAEVAMVGAVGADAYGDQMRRALTHEGVDTTGLVKLAQQSTGVAVPLVTPDGEVAFVQHPGANRHLGPQACDDLPACDLLLLQGEVPAPTSQAAAERIAARGGLVVLNPAPVGAIGPELVELADVVVPNRVEARDLARRLGIDAAAPNAPTLAARLARGDRRAVITLGARGAAWAAGGAHGLISSPEIAAVDATGSGDSFTAALAVALAEGADLVSATEFACAAGAHAATVAGAEPGLPLRAHVQALLSG